MVKKKYLILKDSFALISSVVLGELQFYLLLDLGFGKPYRCSLFFRFTCVVKVLLVFTSVLTTNMSFNYAAGNLML